MWPERKAYIDSLLERSKENSNDWSLKKIINEIGIPMIKKNAAKRRKDKVALRNADVQLWFADAISLALMD